jgi:hypothetical protein
VTKITIDRIGFIIPNALPRVISNPAQQVRNPPLSPRTPLPRVISKPAQQVRNLPLVISNTHPRVISNPAQQVRNPPPVIPKRPSLVNPERFSLLSSRTSERDLML